MISTASFYNLLIDTIRKDKRGKSLQVDEYNRLSDQVNQEVFSAYCDKFEEDIENTDTLAGFKTYNASIGLALVGSEMIGALPSDYSRIIGKPRTVVGSTTRRVDVVTTLELATRASDYLTQPTLVHPVCQIGDEDSNGYPYIRVSPSTVTNLYVDYLREPATPFLDYYVSDTTLGYTFLTAGATGVNVPSGYTYRTGTVGGALVTVNSATVNWEWSIDDVPLLIAKFLSILGITIPDAVLMQAGTINEQKILSQ